MNSLNHLRQLVESHLGKPYELGACGEGPDGRFDQYPVDRDDAFDCLTYVNHVLAAYLSVDVRRINYLSDEVSYVTRCHYMLPDWLPHNVSAGRLAWITEDLGFVTQTVTRDFDRGWFFRNRSHVHLRLLNSVDAAMQAQLVQELQSSGPKDRVAIAITYIGWADLQRQLAKLQAGLPPVSMMLVVRPGDDYVQTCGMVTHLGFVLNDEEGLYFVHAKHNESVQKEKLSDYLARFSDSPSVEGASFLRVASAR